MRIRYGAYLQSQVVCSRAVLCGMGVSVGNLSMILVSYGSGGSVSWSQLVAARARSSPWAVRLVGKKGLIYEGGASIDSYVRAPFHY